MKNYLLLFFLLLLNFNLFSESMLSKEIYDIIDQTVFEVILSKPTKDSLTYEKELPLDLIPFKTRNDKYIPIGTAFAISNNEFVSAAHVFSLESKTQWENIYLRDKQGDVYEVNDILEYSNHKDYVIFNINEKKIDHFLKMNLEPEMNEAVYAVGNAFGDGIIIRNGVLTSKTPEEENGSWDWYRFSAAASPGNSGGPLLDKDGKLIGIITMKSENENLNYALPISELTKGKKNLAIYHSKLKYSLANTIKTKLTTYDDETKLPLNYLTYRNVLYTNFSRFLEKTLNALLEENKENFFPYGKGALKLLYGSYPASFPSLITEGEDGNWNSYYPKDTNTAELANNGYIKYGYMNDCIFIYFKKPENYKLIDLYEKPKEYMDLLLKGITLYRNIMSEKIRILSLGEPAEKYDLKDRYDRIWLIRSWLIEYSDRKVLTLSLPVPDGMITLLYADQTGYVDNNFLIDAKELVNYIFFTYYGTFKEWNEFLQNKKYLPTKLAEIDFNYTTNTEMNLKTQRLILNTKPNIFTISENSDMSLKFIYFKENDKVQWDIGAVIIGENRNKNNFFSLYKQFKPVEGLNEAYFKSWEKLCNQEYPFNNNSMLEEGNTIVQSLHTKYKKMKNTTLKNENFIYITKISMEGKINNFKINKKIKDVNAAITILE